MLTSGLTARALRLAVPIALAVASIAAGTEAATASTTAAGCPTVWFIGARGSGEPPQSNGLGIEASELSADVATVLNGAGLTMKTYADSYRADSVDDFIPSQAETSKLESMISAGNSSAAISYYYVHNVTPYLASIKAGVATAIKDTRLLNYYCPSSDLILAGYSQGAMVMHQAEWRLAKNYPTVAKRIVGTVLVADGDRVPDTKATQFGTATSSGEGVRTWLKENNGADVMQPASTANICNAGDIVCDFNAHRLYPAPSSEKAGAAVHTNYANDPALSQAATWAANQALTKIGATA